jgi:hypothetical protein
MTGREPHDVPTAAQLVEAVREFLERDVMAATDGRVRFHTRVAVNALNMVQRELELGPAQAAAHRTRLEALGVADEAALAAAIRSGALDDRRAEVVDALRATVRAKLEVSNPGYLPPASR